MFCFFRLVFFFQAVGLYQAWKLYLLFRTTAQEIVDTTNSNSIDVDVTSSNPQGGEFNRMTEPPDARVQKETSSEMTTVKVSKEENEKVVDESTKSTDVSCQSNV